MAVYTHVEAEDASEFLSKYDVGKLRNFKAIAEGVENSNYLVETTKGRYFLTLYENRVDPADLPFFHDLLDHLKRSGCKVPAFIADRSGAWLQQLCGRPACLIEFLPGVSVSRPTSAQSHAVGRALGELHLALRNFSGSRENSLGLAGWEQLATKCGNDALEGISAGLSSRIADEFALLKANWPNHLPRSIIHGDLFPDNVLMIGDQPPSLIDFYFACNEIRAYDIAVTHAAWSFSSDGSEYLPHIGTALLDGYGATHGLNDDHYTALPWLLRGASLRFLLTRCYDWINTPADALVKRKDPLAFLRRLDFYADSANIENVTGHRV
ncbi:MAG: homoserine kinase [Sphingorhabdus sp.]